MTFFTNFPKAHIFPSLRSYVVCIDFGRIMDRPFGGQHAHMFVHATVRSILIALVLGVLVAVFGTHVIGSRATASDQRGAGPRLVVMGDSITASYNDDDGDERQGWWSMVGRHLNQQVVRSAQAGSGYIRRGAERCDGTRFYDRRNDLRGADIVIIEGGRNDWKRCGTDMATVGVHDVRAAIVKLLDWVDRQPVADKNVYLMSPWGPMDQLAGITMTQIIQTEAEIHGFHFIDTWGALSAKPGRTYDGIHPTLAGSTSLYRYVIANSDLESRWAQPAR